MELFVHHATVDRRRCLNSNSLMVDREVTRKLANVSMSINLSPQCKQQESHAAQWAFFRTCPVVFHEHRFFGGVQDS